MYPKLKKKNGATKPSSIWAFAFGIALMTVTLFLALGSYNPQDPSLNSHSSHFARPPYNVLGYLGSWSADLFFQGFGWGAWIWPSLLLVALGRWLFEGAKKESILGTRWWVAALMLLAASSLFVDLLGLVAKQEAFPPQGLLGLALSALFLPLAGKVGSYIIVVSLLWAFCMLWWESLPHLIAVSSYKALLWGHAQLKARLPGLLRVTKEMFSPAEKKDVSVGEEPNKAVKISTEKESPIPADATDVVALATAPASAADENLAAAPIGPVIRVNTAEDAPPAPKSAKAHRPSTPRHWQLPPLSLLESAKKKVRGPAEEKLRETAKKIEGALKSFEIDGEVVEISPGPIITMYEFQPGPGVRVQKIVSASTDLAMTLGVPSVRIVAPVPGKSVAGIEVPNADREDILLRDVYESTLDRAKTLKLPLVLGRDGEGRPVCEDLSRMPHLLVGGATSMGKSVLVNSILSGLMCRFNPDELKLIIVDPKLVEFKAFEDIPHLLLPIVNDAQDASQALKWAVSETKRRYVLMQKYSAKNLETYNQKIAELRGKATGDEAEKLPEAFPYIVIIIDELAELMLTGKKDVEQSIVRLTQLARAAGLHLIMATQRPSADVVTGLIKSNCPSRAALRVASASDSRIILDCAGAEQLLGRGDMFFTSTGPMGLKRMQSCFISDGEIEKICAFWRDQGEPDYKDEILAPESEEANSTGDEDSGALDDLYDDVLDFAKERGKISTSLIQRRFQIGYTRAARIMEQLESRGVVSDQQSAGKAREVIA